MALAGGHSAKGYGATSGMVGTTIFWAVTMARGYGSAIPRALSSIDINNLKDERVRLLVTTSPISSAVPSTPPSDSPRSSRNAECSSCKLLLGKIKVNDMSLMRRAHHANG
nr:hypothetical protein [Tanacetum cinerariifolium]